MISAIKENNCNGEGKNSIWILMRYWVIILGERFTLSCTGPYLGNIPWGGGGAKIFMIILSWILLTKTENYNVLILKWQLWKSLFWIWWYVSKLAFLLYISSAVGINSKSRWIECIAKPLSLSTVIDDHVQRFKRRRAENYLSHDAWLELYLCSASSGGINVMLSLC